MKNNIIANFIGKFWSILSNFLFIPLYIHFLGFESYSIISFTLVIAGLMTILDVGLTATLSREFSRVDNSYQEKIRIFKTLQSTYFVIIGISIIILFSLSGIIADNWLKLKNFDSSRLSFFLKIISFDFGFQLLLRFYVGGLLGLEEQVKANIYQIGWGFLRNGLVVLVIILVPTLEMFFIWQAISTVIFTLLIGQCLGKLLTNHCKFDFKPKIESSVFKGIWRFAGGMLLISLVASLNTQMDKLAISKLLPIEHLGYYTLAVSLSMTIIVLVNPIAVALQPRFTALYSAGRREEASILFNRVNLFVAILSFSIMANIALFAKELIWIWTGKKELAEHVFHLIPVIVFAHAMLSLQIIPYIVAIANGYTKLNNFLGLISLIVTLPGYWIAVSCCGSIGSAYLFGIIQTISTFVYIYFIYTKFIKANGIILLYIKQMILPLLIALCIALGFSFIPTMVLQSRIYTLIWIGLASMTTLFVTTIILIPINALKPMFKF